MKGKILSKILGNKVIQKTVEFTVEHAPKILTGLSIASSLAATAFAIKGTILAVDIEKQRKAKIESGELPKPEHPRWELIKSVGKCYIPTVVFHVVAIGSALYGVDISTARTVMATAACKATEYAFDEYKTKVAEEIGAEKANQIQQDIERDHVEQRANNVQTPIVAPFEKYLCKEKISGVEFYSNLFEIKDAFISMNYDLVHGGSDELSVAGYLDHFGIPSDEEDKGWNIGTTGLLVLSYFSETDDYGRPMIVFGPTEKPYENYNIYG